MLDVIDRTPWIADSLTLFDFEVGRAADGPIQPVTLAGDERLEPIAGDATGGCFLLVGTGTDRPVLYIGSEGEGGLIANSLRETLALVVGVASLHDATTLPVEQDDGQALRDYLARADEEIREVSTPRENWLWHKFRDQLDSIDWGVLCRSGGVPAASGIAAFAAGSSGRGWSAG